MGKKKKSLFFKVLCLLFLVYVALSIAYESGYYTTKASNRVLMTKEAMEQFEEDLKNGEMVDLKTYLKEDKVDYSNKITKVGNKLSNSISEVLTNGISGLFKTLKGLFW